MLQVWSGGVIGIETLNVLAISQVTMVATRPRNAAVIPTSLGTRGSLLRPAIFEFPVI